MKVLLSAVVLPFFLLCLDAVGILPLPSFFETVLTWVCGLSLLAGAAIFGPVFFRRLFDR